jgi:hypothetical protein
MVEPTAPRRRACVRRGLYRMARPCENRRDQRHSEDLLMDKKAKTPKKPKQNKAKDGAAKGK